MKNQKIDAAEFAKSLDYLLEVSKGMGGTQIAQGRQKRPSHPNPEEQQIDDYEETKFKDSLDENGTDYKHMEQLEGSSSVGEDSDSDQEHMEVESDQFAAGKAKRPKKKEMAKAMHKADDEGEDHEDEKQDKKLIKEMMKKKDKKVSKSFEEDLEDDEVTNKGIEVSEFLAHFAKSQVGAMGQFESKVETLLEMIHTEQAQFNSALAKAVKAIGSAVLEHDTRITGVEGQPLPRKSKMQVVEKSFGDAAQGGTDNKLSTKDIKDRLVAAVEAGKLSAHDVIKFESTNYLSDAAKAVIR